MRFCCSQNYLLFLSYVRAIFAVQGSLFFVISSLKLKLEVLFLLVVLTSVSCFESAHLSLIVIETVDICAFLSEIARIILKASQLKKCYYLINLTSSLTPVKHL